MEGVSRRCGKPDGGNPKYGETRTYSNTVLNKNVENNTRDKKNKDKKINIPCKVEVA